ncbi:hypothetical protein LINGRAPRIM_LOCUS3068 [Linum grandiflorum]
MVVLLTDSISAPPIVPVYRAHRFAAGPSCPLNFVHWWVLILFRGCRASQVANATKATEEERLTRVYDDPILCSSTS